MKRFIVAVAIAAVAGAGLVAQETRSSTLLTTEHYLDWERVSDAQISPDGSRYAWVEFNSQASNFHVHVTDIATGRDRVLNLPSGNWSLLAFTTAGLYVNQSYPEVGAAPGL